jgi:hypothetical protein
VIVLVNDIVENSVMYFGKIESCTTIKRLLSKYQHHYPGLSSSSLYNTLLVDRNNTPVLFVARHGQWGLRLLKHKKGLLDQWLPIP